MIPEEFYHSNLNLEGKTDENYEKIPPVVFPEGFFVVKGGKLELLEPFLGCAAQRAFLRDGAFFDVTADRAEVIIEVPAFF